jgi:hypothetical protein
MNRSIEIQQSVPVKWETREDAYGDIGAGGLGVEIGVRRGANARKLLEIAKPDKLFLVDPWQGELKHWKPNGPRKEQTVWDENCKITTNKFKSEIAAGRVVVCRCTGCDARDLFPLESLAWCYVDGCHMFAHAFMDLYYFYRRIKPGGYLMAHDFCYEVADGGVVYAIDLLRRILPGIEIVGRSAETCSTIVMRIGTKGPMSWL